MNEARSAAVSYDVAALDKQKSSLIRDINHIINDENFYDQPVAEYRLLATLQTLINDWRQPEKDLERLASYEDQIMKHLITARSPEHELAQLSESPGENRLLMKVMMKKLNEKYAGVLNGEQRSLIRAYAFSAANDDDSSIRLKLIEVKDVLIASINSFEVEHPENTYINKKLVEAKEQLLAEDLATIDDDVVTRFMLYTKLSEELGTEGASDV